MPVKNSKSETPSNVDEEAETDATEPAWRTAKENYFIMSEHVKAY